MNFRRLTLALVALGAACGEERGRTPVGPSFVVGPGAPRYIVVFQDDVSDVPGVAGA